MAMQRSRLIICVNTKMGDHLQLLASFRRNWIAQVMKDTLYTFLQRLTEHIGKQKMNLGKR